MTPQLKAAYNKGRRDGLDGKAESDCPYPDHRKASGSVTFSRAFRNAWYDGWRDGGSDRLEKMEDLDYEAQQLEMGDWHGD